MEERKEIRNILKSIAGLAFFAVFLFALIYGTSVRRERSFENSGAVFAGGPPEKKVSILALGDIMLDRQVRQLMDQHGEMYPFENIVSLIEGNDIVYANLEGPITKYPSKTAYRVNAPLLFTFATSTATLLSVLGFDVVSLANNHTDNFGIDGLMQTKKHLTDNGIVFFGDPQNADELSAMIEKNGVKVGFIGYHGLVDSGYQNVIREIQSVCPAVDFCIVAPHWGVEYQRVINPVLQKMAHEFIDGGADLVLGAHPHVIEPIEIYKNKAIFYSLGNFVFDQNFSYDTTHGLAVGVTIYRDKVEYELIPISIPNSQPRIAGESDRKKILDEISKNSVVSEEVKSEILTGTFMIHR